MPDSAARVHFSGGDRYIRAALSGLTARQRTIANNVANVDTPNFKASEVRFEDTLRAAMRRGNALTAGDAALQAGVRRTSTLEGTSSRGDGNNVDIEREMELLAEANLTYSALTQTLATRIGILRNVINGR
jgi:flagellar basal-body rod protein FlgB